MDVPPGRARSFGIFVGASAASLTIFVGGVQF
jgi:hypothetical protein